MKRYLLDTNACADCIFKQHSVYGKVLLEKKKGVIIGIGLPTLAELYAGVCYSQSKAASMATIERHLTLFKLWPFDTSCTLIYGTLYADLRQRGFSIGQNDLQLASIATSLGNCTIVTTDSDFNHVPGLTVENWRMS